MMKTNRLTVLKLSAVNGMVLTLRLSQTKKGSRISALKRKMAVHLIIIAMLFVWYFSSTTYTAVATAASHKIPDMEVEFVEGL